MITVIRAGLHTSVQDLGRFGFRKFGIPLSGAMDQESATRANQLVANKLSDAILEFQIQGPHLHFSTPTRIAICGGDFEIQLNDKPIAKNQVIEVEPNSILKIGGTKAGIYGYLAIAGGLDFPVLFGSRSFYPGISLQQKLNKNDHFSNLRAPTVLKQDYARIKTNVELEEVENISIFQGPEFDQLTPAQKKRLLEEPFQLSLQLSRMGYLCQKTPELSTTEIMTSPVQPGTIQLTPSGQLIILMRDAQTTGGYARIGQLTTTSINNLTRLQPSKHFHFILIK